MIRSYLYSAKHHNTNLGGRSATPPPTKFVKYDGKDAGICAKGVCCASGGIALKTLHLDKSKML